MAITFEGAGAKANSNGSGVAAPAYPVPGVAAGNLALCFRSMWGGTAVAATPGGWASVADLAGGTGALGDNHTGKIHVDSRTLDGSESGTVNFSQTTQLNGTAAIGVWSKSGTWDVAAATGDDASHGTGRTATASTTLDLAPGDVLVMAVSVDTDLATAFTSVTPTAAGITFSAVSDVVALTTGNTAGNDGNLIVYAATVTAGTATVAPTLTMVGGPSQCGPVAFVRLREVAVPVVEPDDAAHTHTATEPTLTQHHVLTPDAAVHAHSATSPTLVQHHLLDPDDAAHGHVATSPALTQHHSLSVDSASHTHTATSPTLTPVGPTVAPDDALHTHSASSPTLTQHHVLVPADAFHAHAATSPTLVQHHVLTVDSAGHAHVATSPSLVQRHQLVVDSASHAHVATSPTVTPGIPFTPAGDALAATIVQQCTAATLTPPSSATTLED